MTISFLPRVAEVSFDAAQQTAFDALQARHAELASMYRAVVQMLAADSPEADRRMRLAFICHGMREVMDRFKSVMTLSGRNAPKPIEDLTSQLPALVAAFPDLDLASGQQFVPVPGEVALLIDTLVQAVSENEAHYRAVAAELLTDDGNVNHPAVGQWMAARRFFLKWVHIHAQPTEPGNLPTDDEIGEKVQIVANLIDARTKLFFDAVAEVVDLVAEINRTDEVAP